jgi:tetratricopeptide (TPR) repeat protein
VDKALDLNDEFPDAHNNRGGILLKMGRQAEAIHAFKRVVEIQPDHHSGWNNLGLAQQQGGTPEQAEASFRRAIEHSPMTADYCNNLGGVLMPQGRFEEAVLAYREAIRLAPEFSGAWNNLGNALLCVDAYRENYPEAEKAYESAIRLQPDLVEAYFNYGTCLQPQGEHDRALELFRKAVELKPGYVDALACQVTVLERLGRFDDAERILEPLLVSDPDNIHVVVGYGELSRHLDRQEHALKLLQRCSLEGVSERDQISRHFIMGKLYDELKHYDEAFEHYHAGNLLEPEQFNVSETDHMFSTMSGAITRDKQLRRPKASNESELPIFIVGMPRSGTSLVEQILASHPDIYGAGELEDIFRMTGTLTERFSSEWPYPNCLDDATQERVDEVADEHLRKLQAYCPEAARISDKMPHNFLALGTIELLFPKAKIIHCRRNPIDTCISIYFQRFNAHHLYASDLGALGYYYRHYERLMQYWRDTLTIDVLEVTYEDVVADQEGMSRKMLEFCGLPWDERCLDYHKLERTVNTPSYDQVRRPIYTQSVERWRRYESHLKVLIDALEGGDCHAKS